MRSVCCSHATHNKAFRGYVSAENCLLETAKYTLGLVKYVRG